MSEYFITKQREFNYILFGQQNLLDSAPNNEAGLSMQNLISCTMNAVANILHMKENKNTCSVINFDI